MLPAEERQDKNIKIKIIKERQKKPREKRTCCQTPTPLIPPRQMFAFRSDKNEALWSGLSAYSKLIKEWEEFWSGSDT
jgi:hypothetical protein